LNVRAGANCPEWGSPWLSSVHPGICFDKPLSFLRFPKSSFTVIFPCDIIYSMRLRRQELLLSSLKVNYETILTKLVCLSNRPQMSNTLHILNFILRVVLSVTNIVVGNTCQQLPHVCA
jgi:hypothetical protein